jgi:hypothetical protein
MRQSVRKCGPDLQHWAEINGDVGVRDKDKDADCVTVFMKCSVAEWRPEYFKNLDISVAKHVKCFQR